ncbi:PDZ domain-containing protein [Paenibacillus sp. PsM32]|uniref:YlbL family protein n=1 Tax=Paenibacillus sp. PsM32 TaxID=3030536 RepID=UPI00263AD09F|nr:S16 family serine protease [Paenibacillus sp. PsM32]MDN4616604.1 PDZ domain-containing protein [Paenibacillus sp. PsM32]
MPGRLLKSPMSRKQSLLYIICVVILVYVLVYMPTPYMINGPGSADELKPIVSVTGGQNDEKGTFMLTTISVTYANTAMLIASLFDSNEEIVRKTIQSNRAEYEAEQLYYMSSSQSYAIAAAYKKAGIPYRVQPQYVFVVSVPDTNTTIHAGDKFVSIDGQSITSFEQLEQVLKTKKDGQQVKVVLERAGSQVTEQIGLTQFKDSQGQTRVGFGVSIGEVQKIAPEDARHEVNFANTNIGGPSAGLMFTLEIYNQLTAGDLTRGHRIAGTGTINPQGQVGEIGGVQHKVVAAQQAGATIFLVPQGNYADAKAQLSKMKSSMQLIPVSTLDDALKALDTLSTS